MTNIQVKGVPEEVHEVLRQRASAAGKSLQEYLLAWFTEAASRPTVVEVMERVGHRSGGGIAPAQALKFLREDRDH